MKTRAFHVIKENKTKEIMVQKEDPKTNQNKKL